MSRQRSVDSSRPASPPSSWTVELLDHLKAETNPSDRQALQALAAHPWPSRQQESWRFTDLTPLLAVAPRRLAAPDRVVSPPGTSSASAKFVLHLDGATCPLHAVDLPDGLTPLAAEEANIELNRVVEATRGQSHWSVLLNNAMNPPVLALRVSGSIAPVIELVSNAGAEPGVLPLRIQLILEEGASLQLLQIHRSSGVNLTNVLVEVSLGAGSQLHHGLVAMGSGNGVLLSHLAVAQAKESQLNHTSISSGWALARTEPRILQIMGTASTRLRGLQLAKRKEVVDSHCLVKFGGPEGRLDQLHKSVADGAGRSLFRGGVEVPRQAQRTDAVQMSRNLLLSDRARIDTQPQMEIVADDVKCAHGATVARLSEDEMFYLQSRGIAAPQAARLLMRGFCGEVLANLPGPPRSWNPLEAWFEDEVNSR